MDNIRKCCDVTAKYISYIYNLLVFISGVVLLVVGILATIKFGDYHELIYAPILTIILGTLAIIFSVFGCFRTEREVPQGFSLFFILAAILFIFQMVIAIMMLIVDVDSLEEMMKANLKDVFSKYYTDPTNDSKYEVDQIQREYECCGIDGPTYWSKTGSEIPRSCKDKVTQEYYVDGCSRKYADYHYQYASTFGIIIIVVTAIEILCTLYYCINDALVE